MNFSPVQVIFPPFKYEYDLNLRVVAAVRMVEQNRIDLPVFDEKIFPNRIHVTFVGTKGLCRNLAHADVSF